MHDCPFCGDPIDDVLARFGGTCPRCFGEIPGEDAATDPGASPEPVDTPTPDRPRLSLAFAIGGGVILGVSLAILAVLSVRAGRPAPRQVLDFDDWPMPEVVTVAEAVVPEGAPENEPTARRRRPEAFVPTAPSVVPSGDLTASLRSGTPTRSDTPATRRSGLRGPARARAVPKTRAGASSLSSAGTGVVDVSLGGGRVERDDNVVLDDPAAIRTMIGERLRRGIAELRGCYDRRLKQRPDLSGRWRLTFTVSEEGRATGARLAGLDTGDETLERCLRDHVSKRWAFARVAEATEVSRTLSFHVGR